MEVIKKDLKEIEQMVIANAKASAENTDRIIKTMEKLHSHEEKINNNTNKIQENSYALEILRDYKRESKTYLIFAIVGWLFAIICLVLNFIK